MKDQARLSPNVTAPNPFEQLLTWWTSPPLEDLAAGPLHTDEESYKASREQAVKQDRVTPADAAFDRRNPFKVGMEQAAQSDKILNSYKRQQRSKDYFETVGELTIDDFKSTPTYDRPASRNKKARPTSKDVMDARRRAAFDTVVIPRADKQVQRDVQEEAMKRRDMARSRQPLGSPAPQRNGRLFNMGELIKGLGSPGTPMTKDGQKL